MSNTKFFVKLLAVLVVVCSRKLCESHIAELFFEEDDLNEENPPMLVAPNLALAHVSNSQTNVMEDNTCHVEFTVLKKAVGRCIKLGKTMTTACVSGSYIQPFHADCM